MTRECQAQLICVLKDAMNAQDITLKHLGRSVGIPAGTLNPAFANRSQMSEEKWRMCCEYLGVSFDKFMAAYNGYDPTDGTPAPQLPHDLNTDMKEVKEDIPMMNASVAPTPETAESLKGEKLIANLIIKPDQSCMLAAYIEATLPEAVSKLNMNFADLKTLVSLHDAMLSCLGEATAIG